MLEFVQQHGPGGSHWPSPWSKPWTLILTASLPQEAEAQALEFVQRHTDGSTGHHLAGSSVHIDLAFLRRGMPRLAAHMPYRVVVRRLIV